MKVQSLKVKLEKHLADKLFSKLLLKKLIFKEFNDHNLVLAMAKKYIRDFQENLEFLII